MVARLVRSWLASTVMLRSVAAELDRSDARHMAARVAAPEREGNIELAHAGNVRAANPAAPAAGWSVLFVDNDAHRVYERAATGRNDTVAIAVRAVTLSRRSSTTPLETP
jgi:hypothetical protein